MTSSRRRTRTLARLSTAVLLAGAVTPLLRAADTTWLNSTGNSLWGDPGNWNNGVPDATKIATIGASGTIDLGGAARAAKVLNFGTLSTLSNGHVSTNVVSGQSYYTLYSTVGALGGVLDLSDVYSGEFIGGIGDGNGGGDFTVIAAGNLRGPDTHTGPTLIRNLNMPDQGGAITRTSSIEISGVLTIDNYLATSSTTDRLPDSAPIRLRSGGIALLGSPTVSSTERIGEIDLVGGGGGLSVTLHGAVDPENPVTQTLVVQALHRDRLATFGLNVHRIDNMAKVRLLETPEMTGGGIGATQRPVLGYATGDFLYREGPNRKSITSFATYDPGPTSSPDDDNGLRMLDTRTEYANNIAPGASLDNVRLTTSRTLSGDASINALAIDTGHLALENNAALTINSGGMILSGTATGTFTAFSAVSGSGRLVFTDEAMLRSGGPMRTTIDVPIQANTLIYNGTGLSTVILNRPNSYSGGTHFHGGNLGLGTQGALGGGSLEMSGGVLLFTGASQSYDNPIFIGEPETAGAMHPISYGGEISVDAGIEATLTGTMSSYAYVLGKSGPGLLRLNGDYNAERGGQIWVREGTLAINGTARSNAAQNPLVINVDYNNGTLTGNGTVLGTVGAHNICPGDGIGRLTVQRFVGADTNFFFELHGPEPAVGYDQIVTLQQFATQGNLTLLCDFAPAFGTTFLIMDNRFSDRFDAFVGLPQNSIVTASNGAQFRINYFGGDGNEVVLSAVPEPNSIGLLVASIVAVAGAGSRRGRRSRREVRTFVRGG